MTADYVSKSLNPSWCIDCKFEPGCCLPIESASGSYSLEVVLLWDPILTYYLGLSLLKPALLKLQYWSDWDTKACVIC